MAALSLKTLGFISATSLKINKGGLWGITKTFSHNQSQINLNPSANRFLSTFRPLLNNNPESDTKNSTISVPVPDKLYKSIELEIRAHQPDVLKSYAFVVEESAKHLGVRVTESWKEPEPNLLRKTLLKSVFVHSKHRVQYEFRTYFWLIKAEKLTGSTADTWLEYIQRLLPEGVSMKVNREQLLDFPENIRKSIDNTLSN